jgi:hypothetical protein
MNDSLKCGKIRFTILESGGQRRHPLCKKFVQTDNGIEKSSYQNQYLFTWFEQFVDCFDDLADTLSILESEAYACVIFGQVDPDAPRLIRRLKYDDLDRTGEENKAWIRDEPTRVLHFDFDDLEMPDWLDWTTPHLVAGFVVEHLTERLGTISDVSYYWQASSSAAVGGSRIAKMHIWMISDVALDGSQRKALYELAGSDKGIASSVHIQYTAAPIFSDMSDPLPTRSGVVKGSSDDLPVSCLKTQLESKVEASAQVVDFTTVHHQQCRDLGDHERSIVLKRLRQIRDRFFRDCVSGNRNNALNRAAFEIGTLAHFGIVDVEAELAAFGRYAIGQGHASQRATSAIQSGFNAGRGKIFVIHPPKPSVDERDAVLKRRKELKARKRAKVQDTKEQENV